MILSNLWPPTNDLFLKWDEWITWKSTRHTEQIWKIKYNDNTVKASNFGPHGNFGPLFQKGLLSSKCVLQKKRREWKLQNSFRSTDLVLIIFGTWFHPKKLRNLQKNGPKFPWGLKLEAFNGNKSNEKNWPYDSLPRPKANGDLLNQVPTFWSVKRSTATDTKQTFSKLKRTRKTMEQQQQPQKEKKEKKKKSRYCWLWTTEKTVGKFLALWWISWWQLPMNRSWFFYFRESPRLLLISQPLAEEITLKIERECPWSFPAQTSTSSWICIFSGNVTHQRINDCFQNVFNYSMIHRMLSTLLKSEMNSWKEGWGSRFVRAFTNRADTSKRPSSYPYPKPKLLTKKPDVEWKR